MFSVISLSLVKALCSLLMMFYMNSLSLEVRILEKILYATLKTLICIKLASLVGLGILAIMQM